jgi:hypothetical protein
MHETYKVCDKIVLGLVLVLSGQYRPVFQPSQSKKIEIRYLMTMAAMLKVADFATFRPI